MKRKVQKLIFMGKAWFEKQVTSLPQFGQDKKRAGTNDRNEIDKSPSQNPIKIDAKLNQNWKKGLLSLKTEGFESSHLSQI